MYRFAARSLDKRFFSKNFTSSKRIHNGPGQIRQAGFGKLFIILSPVAVTGAVITYANYDQEFRKTLVTNVPGADTILKIALKEENPLENITKKVSNVTSTVTGIFGGSSEKKTDSYVPSSRNAEKSETKSSPATKSPVEKPELKTEQKPSAAVILSHPKETIPKEISEFERSIEVAAALAVEEYNRAIELLKSYNEDVRKTVEQAVEKLDLNSWTSLKNRTSARDTAVELAETSARNAFEKIELYEVELAKIANKVDVERLQNLRDKIRSWTDHINRAKDLLYKSKHETSLSEKYWRKVESGRNYFIDEIESIFPGINLSEKKMNLSQDDLDLFIMHAYSHVLTYQKELQRLQLDGEMRLKRAIEALRGDDQSEAVNAQVEYHLDREKRSLALENQRKLFQIRSEAEKELRQQLKRQSQAHVDHLQDAITQKEAELRRTFNRELDEKVSSEKAAYKLQLASMLGKLKGMDAALKARAESEKCAHQAQALWAACQALWASVRTGEPGVHWRHKLRPLNYEIKAVNKAAEGDELVEVVIRNLPHEARSRGVYPEDALRERFLNVEKVARKLALVPEEGASLPVYFLSYLQSVFILRPENPISEEELQDKQVDFSKLDTYDILNRARYFLDRGDLTQTMKYMNLLQGASRKISKDWLKEARLLLETQQAANTLMAHAASSGILYL